VFLCVERFDKPDDLREPKVAFYEALSRRIFNQHFSDRSQTRPQQDALSLATVAKE
jgi:hypothetical protein